MQVLYNPRSIDISEAGDVYIAEWQNDRISIWDENGSFKESFGQNGNTDGKFYDPSSLSLYQEMKFL